MTATLSASRESSSCLGNIRRGLDHLDFKYEYNSTDIDHFYRRARQISSTQPEWRGQIPIC